VSSKNVDLGKNGESIAATHALANGYNVIAKNVRTPAGEIDLILEKDGTLVFAEVKTRSGYSYGFPEEAITESKLQHMIDAATHYLIELNPIPDWRLDVISIELYQGKRTQPVIHWIENVSADR
jgi:putative endonuclease